MKLVRIAIVAVFVLAVVGVVTSRLTVKDSISIDIDTRSCAMRDTRQILNNPIERMIIVKTVVEGKAGRTVYTGAYTLFGLRYARARTVCGGLTEVTWRRWFNR